MSAIGPRRFLTAFNMRRKLTMTLIIAALCLGASKPNGDQGASKGSPHGGGKAPSHMSGKGSANTNAQWSADPDRGWVRADERSDPHAKNASSPAQPRKNPGSEKNTGIVGAY